MAIGSVMGPMPVKGRRMAAFFYPHEKHLA
jgi:hypothetical protein